MLLSLVGQSRPELPPRPVRKRKAIRDGFVQRKLKEIGLLVLKELFLDQALKLSERTRSHLGVSSTNEYHMTGQ
jgi:hypothetical protein